MMNLRNAALVLLLPVATFVAHSNCCVSTVSDMFQTPSQCVQIKEEQELGDHLDVVKSEIVRRLAIKDALIAELISGRITLIEVTKQFLILNQSRPEYMTVIRESYPGSTDEEKTTHNVMGYIRAELAHTTPAQQTAVLHRLNIEFDLAYPTKSGGEFPGVPASARKEADSGAHQPIDSFDFVHIMEMMCISASSSEK